MTSLVKAIQERLAKICEDITHYPDPVTGVMHMQESHFTHPGNHKCAAAIRAADLSDLEPKAGAAPRTDEVVARLRVEVAKFYGFNGAYAVAEMQTDARMKKILERDTRWQAADTIAALTARLEAAEGELAKRHNLTAVERLQAISAMKSAHNFLQEHWSGNPDWKKGNEHLWIARADFELERGIEAFAKDSYE